jgi:membrane protein implicated in regulation of membrane protease activity
MSQTPHFRRVWSIPILLAALSVAGLLSALLGEHIAWKAVAWITLAVPVAVGLWYALLRGRERTQRT